MSTYTWPTSGSAFALAGMTWYQSHNVRSATSVLSRAVQTTSLPGMTWGVALDFPAQTYDERAQLEGFLSRLSGGEHRLALWDVARPLRRGTCNLAGVTVSQAAVQFAGALMLSGCGASTTMLAGSRLAVATSTGAQLMQVCADAIANASGVMVVEVRDKLRGAVTAGAAVTLDKPTALFVLAEPRFGVPRGGANLAPAFSVELVEVFA